MYQGNKNKKNGNKKQVGSQVLPTNFHANLAPTANLAYPIMIPSWPPPNPDFSPRNDNHTIPNQKICTFCKREPKYSCYRCGACYCSQECQKHDWLGHRFTCFAMPPLVPLKGTIRTAPPISPLPKPQSRVLLTGFRRPNICYVRSMDPKDDEQFLRGNAIINKYGSSAQHMTEVPVSNTYAIAFYEEQYHRIQVLSANTLDSVRALFIDKGVVKTINLRDLRKICDNTIKILQRAVAIKLKDVENYLVSDEIEYFLNQFCGKEFLLSYNEGDEEKEFILQELGCDRSLNESIVSFANKQKNLGVYNNFNPGKSVDKEIASVSPKKNENKLDKPTPDGVVPKPPMRPLLKPVFKPPFQFSQFGEDDKDFTIVVLDDSSIGEGQFGCMVRNNQKFLDRIASYFRTYMDDQIAYEPQLFEYCLANIDGRWCRIQILGVFKNIYTVINIDTTFEDKIKSDKIRRYPEDFKVACTTVTCKIDGYHPVSGSRVIENFIKQRFVVNSLHRVNKVTKIENGVRYVQMDDLIDDLALDYRFNLK